jgi:hypothetical protein
MRLTGPGIRLYPSSCYRENMAAVESTMLELGTAAPDFSLPDAVSGKTISLASFAGNNGFPT